ncbi:MAG: VOC family protein [Bacteroidota bacterium]
MESVIIPAEARKVPSKFQHLVLFTKDHEQSARWYQRVFNLQWSARNHPDSSAAMRIIKQTMYFFSFGYYHHDLALVSRPDVTPDNSSLLYFSLQLKPEVSIEAFRARLRAEGIDVQPGPVLASAQAKDARTTIHFQDPINQYWIEVIKTSVKNPQAYPPKAGKNSSHINHKKIKRPKHCMPESLSAVGGLMQKQWLRSLILLPSTLSGKRTYNKTEDYGVFRDSKCLVSNTEQVALYVSDLEASITWFEAMGFHHARTEVSEPHPFIEGHTLRCAYLSLSEHPECTVIMEHRDAKGDLVLPTLQDHFHVAYELEGNTLADTLTYFKQNKQLGIQHHYGPAKHNNSKPYGDGESGGNVAVYYYTPDYHNIEFCADMDCIDNYQGRYGTGIRTVANDVYLMDNDQ